MFHHYRYWYYLRVVGLILVPILYFGLGGSSAGPLPPLGWTGGGSGYQNSQDNANTWASMLDVDPSKIISLLLKHGGLWIPESSKKDLDTLAKVCRVESVKLNILERKLEIKNLIVQLPNKGEDDDGEYETEEALRIGRAVLRWDSYLNPCIEIEVEDVTIVMEFFNVLLTQNNWDELKKHGFPPQLADDDASRSKRTWFGKLSSFEPSFVRIGSIDLSGNVVAKLKSRPLQKTLTEVKYALDTFDPLDQQIKLQSLENLARTGRRGCTTEELYGLIQNYIGGLLQQLVGDVLTDIAAGGDETMDKVERVVTLSKKSLTQYIQDTSDWSGNHIQDKLSESLTKWGLFNNEIASKRAVSMFTKHLQQSSKTLLSKNDRLHYIYKNVFEKQDDLGGKGNSDSGFGN